MKRVADVISGYEYGDRQTPTSSITLEELAALKVSAGFTDEEARFLHMAGDVLENKTEAIVKHWRSGIIASIPNLARHSRSPQNEPLPDYLAKSNLRFQQWILDTCLRPYDQEWLNYQQEIALRHTALKKNKTDNVSSTPYVPLRDIVGFISVINETIKPYLAAKNHSADEVDRMHRAWGKSIQPQLALWTDPYTDAHQAPNEW